MNYYNFGVFCGIFFGILLCVIIRKLVKAKNCCKKDEYDERQEILRNRGYRYAYFTSLIGTVLVLILKGAFEFNNLPGYTFLFATVMFVSVGVYVVYCIMNDAYFSLTSNRHRFIILMTILSVFNIVGGIFIVINDRPDLASETLKGYVNIECGTIFLIVGIAMFVKSRIEKKEVEE